MDKRPIGIFDSGVGGLTVVKEIVRALPNENTVYFGDTARVPYGDKSKDVVTKYSKQIVRFLLTKNVKAIVAACNTVSSNSLDELRRSYDVPIIGVVEPGVRSVIGATKNKKVGIIGTEATIRSGMYSTLLHEADSSIEVFSKSCPLFVPLAEEGWYDNQVARLTAQMYLNELLCCGIDTLLLGCTHYPLLKQCIGETIGESVKIVDPAKYTAENIEEILRKEEMLNDGSEKPTSVFYVSDITNKFEKICLKTLKRTYTPAKIDIESY
ncbi:glutamate racemase [Clostridiales bacterium]|nr:glutamate racemase [Clostridiales bacterium]